MPPYVRPPDVNAVNPRQQCAGDWDFFHSSALEFLKSAEQRVDTQLDKSDARKVAHSLKTGAELLCMVSVALAAFELEVASANEADDLEILEHQSVLLEHIIGSRMALEEPAVRANPSAALEAVNGRIDLLRKQPTAPVDMLEPRRTSNGGDRIGGARRTSSNGANRFNGLASARNSIEVFGGGASGFQGGASPAAGGWHVMHGGSGSGSGSGIAFGAGLPFPSRVAVVSQCHITGKLVAATLTGNPYIAAKPEVTVYESLETAAGDSAPVIAFCTCPGLQFSAANTKLPLRAPPLGQRRGFVIIGDVDEQTQEAVFILDMLGWCELVRMPLAAPELVRRVSQVFVAASNTAH